MLDSKGDRSCRGFGSICQLGREFCPFGSGDFGGGTVPSPASWAGTHPTLIPQGNLDASGMRGHLAYRTCPWPLPLHHSGGQSEALLHL